MASLDDASFSSFIDHYILLLSARFNAPIHTWTGRITTRANAADDPSFAAWRLVSRSVQDVLSSTGTQTPQEREQLKHIDPGMFTPQVCRERAMYLQWKIQKTAADRKQRRDPGALEAKKKAASSPGTAANKPSTFDVTKQTSEISDLLKAVRNQLPSVAVDSSSDDDGDDGEVEAFFLQSSNIVNVPMRTDDQVQRDLEVSTARDAMLAKIQDMQAEFFEKHRRWVDVPANVLDAPPAVSSPSNARAQSQAAAAASAKETSELLQELRKHVSVQRPSRPSAMSDEAIEKMFSNSLPPASPMEGVTLVPHPREPSPRLPAVQPQQQPPRTSPMTSNGNQVHKVVKETPAPDAARRRADRWQIKEYDD